MSYQKCNQRELDEIVKDILEGITDEKRWTYICDYLRELCELSPEVVLDRLNKELDESTGLLEIIEKRPKNVLFDRNYSSVVMTSVMSLFVQSDYIKKTFDWLVRLDNQFHKSNYKPDSDEMIKYYLYPYFNATVWDTASQKIKAAKTLMKNNVNGWNIIYEILFKTAGVTFYYLKPEYRRSAPLPTLVDRAEQHKIISAFYDILIENIGSNVNRWQDMIDVFQHILPDYQIKFYVQFQLAVDTIDDQGKILLKKKLINKICNSRMFIDKEWAMNDGTINQLEDFLSYIKMDTPENEYVYLFDNDIRNVLLHPIKRTKTSLS